MAKKEIYYKIYSATGEYIDTAFDWEGGTYTTNINSGYGDLSLTIPRPFDYVWGKIDFNGYVERYVADSDAPNGILTYKGYISEKESRVANNESSSIKCYGYWSKLTKDVMTESSNLLFSRSNINTGALMRDIINNYRTNNTGTAINESTIADIPNTSVTITKLYNGQTYADALLEAKDISGANYYLFLENTNTVKLKTIDINTVNHYWVLGRDVESATYNESIDGLVNRVYIWNGITTGTSRILKQYSDSSSISQYGLSSKLHNDDKITTTTEADKLANKLLSAYSQPLTTLTIRLFDKEYSGEGGSRVDIENIKVGDTFKILNVNDGTPFGDVVYYITSITDYEGKTLEIQSVNASAYTDRLLYELYQKQLKNEWGVTFSQPYTT